MTYSFSIKNKKHNIIIISAFFSAMFIIFSISPSLEMQVPINDTVGILLQYLTTSAGNPYFIVTSALFALFTLTLKKSPKQLFILYMQFSLILALSFVLKSAVKQLTEVPRPFTEQLVEQGFVDSTEQFYLLTEIQKNKVINDASDHFAHQRIKSWYGESNYSFPSGHTIFVATCVVFWAGLFLREKRYFLTTIVVVWATGVAFSRYWLGMHWPADILMSIFCAALLMLLVPDIKLPDIKNHKNSR